MKRRQAIRYLGVGFSSTLLGSTVLSSCKPDDPAPEITYDGTIAIIGAGPAGLYAADILLTKGLKVQVFEASKQLGGRVRSLRNQEDLPYQSIADFPVELGAEYWMGNDSILGKIIANLNLNTVELTPDAYRYILNNQAKTAAEWSGNADFSSVQSFVNGIKTYSGAATSVKSAATGVGTAGQSLLNAQAGNFYGSTSDKVGVKGLAEQQKLVTHDTKLYMLKNNTLQDLIVSRFADVLPYVKTNAPVKSINYSSDPCIITLEDGTEVQANKVIVTVPVTILKNGITFTPALPAAKTNALGKIGMDPCVRFALDFKKNFWGEGSSSFIWGSEGAPQVLNAGFGRSEFYQSMTVTVYGAKALELSALPTEDEMVKRVLTALDAVYANQATAFIRKTLPPAEEKMVYFVKDWTKEPYIKGGMSYPTEGATINDRTALSAPLNSRLFFAGEATDISGEAGMLNGALASAERSSEELVQAILSVS